MLEFNNYLFLNVTKVICDVYLNIFNNIQNENSHQRIVHED